ncbi:MAG: phosphate acyltransferase PlsX [Ruminococcaceae bacterium]|nr:phosphate acyltransferase PlsX [Oscillospiraceae bacterium]
MRIVVDGFGGDFAPEEILFGCIAALEEKQDLELIVTGDEQAFRKIIENEKKTVPSRMSFVATTEIVENEDDPISAIKKKKDSSLVVGLRLVSEQKGDAFVSAGNTGAVLTGATLIIKRIRGIKRAALCPTIPTKKGKAVIVDVGANAECKPEFYPQFAMMGTVYAKELLGIKNPKSGLINIGVEHHKGTSTVVEAHKLLQKEGTIRFVGNIEARDVLNGDAEVLVSDGWTGNITLKTLEGTAQTLFYFLKEVFYQNSLTKLAAAILKPGLSRVKKMMDAKEVGGAPLLGLNAPVVKAHGNSDRVAYKNAILFAATLAEKDVCGKIRNHLS